MSVSPRHPAAKNPAISKQMSRMPRENSKPELNLRRALHKRGLRYRIHSQLPGRPDISFGRARLAIFVDGCFWHACPEHGVLPKNNREWWRQKLESNVTRDRRKDQELAELGWTSLHIWEHTPPEQAADLVQQTRRRLLSEGEKSS